MQLSGLIIVTFALIDAHSQTLKLSPPERFRPYSFATIGGVSGKFGHVDGVGTNALFGGTTGLATDEAGNLFIVDPLLGGQTVRKMSGDGVVTTLAGKPGEPEEVDGISSTARFYQPAAVAADASGNLYVADSYGETIRKVTIDGVVTTLAGLALSEGHLDGFAENARFKYPTGITLDKFGNLYVADQLNHTIRKVTLAGEVTTIAGLALAQGTNDGVGTAARFSYPRTLTMGNDGNIYVADSGNYTIRKITPDGVVSTLAGAPGQSSPNIVDGTGSAARFGFLTGIAADSINDLYVVEAYWKAIRKVTPDGIVTTLSNEIGPIGFKFGGDASSIAIDRNDSIYVADAGDSTILKAYSPPNFEALFLSFTSLDPFQESAVAVIDASTNLTEWLPIQTNFVSRYTERRIVDTNAPSFPHRFYRARTP